MEVDFFRVTYQVYVQNFLILNILQLLVTQRIIYK